MVLGIPGYHRKDHFMEWYEMAENPSAISSLYRQVPDLQSVSIKEISFIQSGALEITIELSYLPDRLPPRRNFQRPGYKYLRLHFYLLKTLQITHRPLCGDSFNIKVEKVDHRFISFDAISSHCSLKGTALSLKISWVKE